MDHFVREQKRDKGKNVCILLDCIREEHIHFKLMTHNYYLVPKLYVFTVYFLYQFFHVTARNVIYIITSALISL